MHAFQFSQVQVLHQTSGHVRWNRTSVAVHYLYSHPAAVGHAILCYYTTAVLLCYFMKKHTNKYSCNMYRLYGVGVVLLLSDDYGVGVSPTAAHGALQLSSNMFVLASPTGRTPTQLLEPRPSLSQRRHTS